jgi:hypothetical protein
MVAGIAARQVGAATITFTRALLSAWLKPGGRRFIGDQRLDTAESPDAPQRRSTQGGPASHDDGPARDIDHRGNQLGVFKPRGGQPMLCGDAVNADQRGIDRDPDAGNGEGTRRRVDVARIFAAQNVNFQVGRQRRRKVQVIGDDGQVFLHQP